MSHETLEIPFIPIDELLTLPRSRFHKHSEVGAENASFAGRKILINH